MSKAVVCGWLTLLERCIVPSMDQRKDLKMKEPSALVGIEFARYRVFEQKQRLDLKPLTLLYGHNSAGKSAALRLLPILAATAKRDRTSTGTAIFDYSSPALRDAVFQDLIHNGQIAAGIQLNFVWENAKYELTLRDIGAGGEVIAGFNLTLEGQTFSGGLSQEGDRETFDVDHDKERSHWKLSGIRPFEAETEEGKQAAADLVQRLSQFASSVHWLGAVRASVPRVFELRPGADGNIRADGSGVAEAIRISAAARDGAAEAVSKWLEKTCQCTLSFAASDEAITFNRRFYPFDVITSAGRRIAVRDVGEGVAQALPVVMLCHQARLGKLGPSPILAFEQPELHLHPAASVLLADEIVACIAQGSRASHVIETHAESMLLSVQIAIVEGRVRPEDVVVYWVAADDFGTSLRPITFDSAGFPIGGWPQGVFRETVNQARRLAQLRIEPTPLDADTH